VIKRSQCSVNSRGRFRTSSANDIMIQQCKRRATALKSKLWRDDTVDMTDVGGGLVPSNHPVTATTRNLIMSLSLLVRDLDNHKIKMVLLNKYICGIRCLSSRRMNIRGMYVAATELLIHSHQRCITQCSQTVGRWQRKKDSRSMNSNTITSTIPRCSTRDNFNRT